MFIIYWFIYCLIKLIFVNFVVIELYVIVNIIFVCKLEFRYRKEIFKYYVFVNLFFIGDYIFYIF